MFKVRLPSTGIVDILPLQRLVLCLSSTGLSLKTNNNVNNEKCKYYYNTLLCKQGLLLDNLSSHDSRKFCVWLMFLVLLVTTLIICSICRKSVFWIRRRCDKSIAIVEYPLTTPVGSHWLTISLICLKEVLRLYKKLTSNMNRLEIFTEIIFLICKGIYWHKDVN